MEMLLMGGVLSLFGIAVVSLAFGAVTRAEDPQAMANPQPKPVTDREPRRFFISPPATHPTAPQVPIEALLLQIENHVRLEQAAAESFLEAPAADLLHSRTISPLIQ